jgi:hypothetical protein
MRWAATCATTHSYLFGTRMETVSPASTSKDNWPPAMASTAAAISRRVCAPEPSMYAVFGGFCGAAVKKIDQVIFTFSGSQWVPGKNTNRSTGHVHMVVRISGP